MINTASPLPTPPVEAQRITKTKLLQARVQLANAEKYLARAETTLDPMVQGRNPSTTTSPIVLGVLSVHEGIVMDPLAGRVSYEIQRLDQLIKDLDDM